MGYLSVFIDRETEGKSLEFKFQHNAIEGKTIRDLGSNFVALKISRINHSCMPNAAHCYNETGRVLVIFSERDIYPGEEICILYRPFPGIDGDLLPSRSMTDIKTEFQQYKDVLLDKWGIRCPPDCLCNDRKARELIV